MTDDERSSDGPPIALDAEFAMHHRKGASHRGIARCKALRVLIASAVNQEYFDEIVQLSRLVDLELGWPTTAEDISGIANLQKLERLSLDSPRNVVDFTPLLRLPSLRSLEIENAKHLSDLSWLRPLKDRLSHLGIDGSINTAQKVESLEPLDGFGFETLSLTNVRLADKDLGPLINCRNLKKLNCARFIASKAQFMRLADARPDLACQWFDEALWPR